MTRLACDRVYFSVVRHGALFGLLDPPILCPPLRRGRGRPVRRVSCLFPPRHAYRALVNRRVQIGWIEEGRVVAYSARILALIQKIDAADAEHFARLREQARKAADARVALSKKKQANPALVPKKSKS